MTFTDYLCIAAILYAVAVTVAYNYQRNCAKNLRLRIASLYIDLDDARQRWKQAQDEANALRLDAECAVPLNVARNDEVAALRFRVAVLQRQVAYRRDMWMGGLMQQGVDVDEKIYRMQQEAP